MTDITSEIGALKEKANTETIRAKQENNRVQIEQERDWFREEALSLNIKNKENETLKEKYKQQFEAASEERDYYQ